MTESDNQTEEINIEAIMQEIRQQIIAKKDQLQPETAPVSVSGKRFSPEFYEHLYQATLVHDQIGVRMHVTKVNVPLIGGLLEMVRTKLHELVLFYVNKMAAEQIQFNTHMLQAVNLMAQQMEQEDSNQ